MLRRSSFQGYDLEMATNCLGPFLLNHLLEPMLVRTAAAESTPNGVRIVWLSSLINASVPDGGIQFSKDGSPRVQKNAMQNYMQSKVGNVFLASEAAKRLGKDGIISVVSCNPGVSCGASSCLLESSVDEEQSVNPGLMKTELQRHSPRIQSVIMVGLPHLMLYQALHRPLA